MNKQRFAQSYRWIIVAVGICVCLWAAFNFPIESINKRFWLLAFVTIASAHITLKIPRHNGYLTASDTFIFLTIMLYGGPAAVLLAAAEGLYSGLRVSKKLVTVLFNLSLTACSTFVAVSVIKIVFGPSDAPMRNSHSAFITAVALLAIAQYVSTSLIISISIALKNNQSLWQAWMRNCLWSSITYFVGAAAAGLLVTLITVIDFYVFFVAVPIVAIVYFTYNKYLEDVKAAAAQAERAEHARAEAERSRAELAERNLAEQKRYISELERISQELQESREHFRHAAFHDALTGLPNRALLTDHLKLAIERAKRRPNHLFAVLFLDLDRFKTINDSLGHAAGDQLLIVIARRLEKCLRPTDTVARLGGDEFAILLDGLEDDADGIRIVERVKKDISLPFQLNGHEVYTTASIGVALGCTTYNDPENILRDADTAMYHAKEKGKARYELFDKEMHANAIARLQLENDLRRAIERKEFQVYYQPIISLETDVIAGFEALIRWQHAQRGFVSPAQFIPIAEETGLIMEIGHWVLQESCRQLGEWQRLLPADMPLTLAVNLSSKQFSQSDLINQVKNILEETGVNPRCLKLEITESVVMENAETAASMLMQLRELGIQLSIDDFGTGYSSLSYLHRFPVDTLKVDRSFVSRMGEGDENSEIVRTIITLANNLGMAVVAEGVETKEQLAKLKNLKCNYGQGYLFAKPVDAEAAFEFVLKEMQKLNEDSHLPTDILNDKPNGSSRILAA